MAVELGSNKNPKIPAFLRHLASQRCVVTVDAIRCQTEIAAQIVAQRADDVLAKANQPTLHEAVIVVFSEAQPSGFVPATTDDRRTVEKDHGRIDVRWAWPIDDPEILAYLDPQVPRRRCASSAWSSTSA